MPIRVAILDLDGTLFDGFLAAHMALALCALPGHARPATAALEAIHRYQAGDITHDECATRFCAAYATAVCGLPTPTLHHIATTVWRRHRTQLFDHTPTLIAQLHTLGLVSCLISGSPTEGVQAAAHDLNIHRWWGLTIAAHNGIATDQILRAPAHRGGKIAVLTELATELDIDWAGSFAIGDSSSDIEVLHSVGHPLAFEPDPPLRRAATLHGWTITHRGNVLNHLHTLSASGSRTTGRPGVNQEHPHRSDPSRQPTSG